MRNLNELVSVEDAQYQILNHVVAMPTTDIYLEDALGCVLAKDVVSDIDISAFDDSAMDGFALRSRDVKDASEDNPVSLKIVANIPAGSYFEGKLKKGEVARIMTGAPVPDGADCVQKIEVVETTGDGLIGTEAIFKEPVSVGKNMRYAGEEARAGEVVLEAGHVVNPASIGLFASSGNKTVEVYKRPKIGIISLGSELVGVDETPGPGQIRDSNSYMLAALVRQAGAVPHRYGRIKDDRELIEAQIIQAINECDFVISSGGASAGDYDFVTDIAGDLGEVYYKYVNMKPGKSQTFAVINGKPYFGLAGNPSASAVGFEILIRPALRKMMGHVELKRPVVDAVMGADLRHKDTRRNYLRGLVKPDGKGGYIAYPGRKQSSALLGALAEGNCLIVVSEDYRSAPKGTEVRCIRLDIPTGTEING